MAEDNSGMSCLYNPEARALDPEFAAAWREYRRGPASGDHPIKEEDAQAFREGLKMAGIQNGKQLGEALGLSDRQGQNLYKNPATLTWKNYRELCAMLDMEAEMFGRGYISQLLEEKTLSEEIQRALDPIRQMERMYGLFYPPDELQLHYCADSELTARCLIDGFNLLDNKRRCALMDTLEGLLAAEHMDIEQSTKDAERQRDTRILKTCKAIRQSISTASPKEKMRALVDLLAGPRVDYFKPLTTDMIGRPVTYEDTYVKGTEGPRTWDNPTEAVMAEYVENSEY